MLYVYLCTFVMIVAICTLHQHISQLTQSLHDASTSRPGLGKPAGALLMAITFSAPMVMIVFNVLTGATADTNSTGDGTTQIYAMLAGSLMCFAAAGLWATSAIRAKSIGFWATGRIVILIMAGTVGTVSAYKHLSFFNNPNAGLASLDLMRDMFPLEDMKDCYSPVVLVQFNEKDVSAPLTYRCPTLILLNQGSDKPFSPWPGFGDGTSQDLADAVSKISEAAEQGGSIQKLDLKQAK